MLITSIDGAFSARCFPTCFQLRHSMSFQVYGCRCELLLGIHTIRERTSDRCIKLLLQFRHTSLQTECVMTADGRVQVLLNSRQHLHPMSNNLATEVQRLRIPVSEHALVALREK